LKLCPGGFKNFPFGDEDDIKRIYEQGFVPSVESSHPSFDFISFNGITDFFTDDDCHSGKIGSVGEINEIEVFASVTLAFLIQM
jgi:hypothetical protein